MRTTENEGMYVAWFCLYEVLQQASFVLFLLCLFVCLPFCGEKMRTVVDYGRQQGLTRKGGVLYLPNDLVTNVYVSVKVSARAFKICVFIARIECTHVHFTLKGKKNQKEILKFR